MDADTGEFTIGQESMYIMPKDELDALIESTNGDLREIEKVLGFNTADLDSGEFRIAMIDDVNSKVSLPTGNEAGANDKWIPGGFTSGGMPEVTYSGSTFEKDQATVSLSDFFGG